MLLWAYSQAPEGFVYIGTQAVNSGDTPVYFSWIEQVRDGHFLQWNLYTPEEHPRFLFDIFWLGVGLVAKWFNLSAIVAYHAARFLFIPLLIGTLYATVAYFFTNVKQRMMALLVVIFSSGFGGLSIFATRFGWVEFGPLPPMDIWVSEGYTFLTLYHSPHFMFSLMLLLLVFLWFLMGWEQKRYRYTISAGVAVLTLLSFHPYHAATIFSVLIVFGFVQIGRMGRIPWDYVRKGFVLGLFSLPPVAYHIWTLEKFYIRAEHAAQNLTFTPDFWIVGISYGALLIFSIVGLVVIFRMKPLKDKYVFLAVWLIVQSALIFAPVNYQRRLTEGLQVVMALVAFIGLAFLFKKGKQKGWFGPVTSHPAVWTGVFIAAFAYSNIFLIVYEQSYYKNQQ